MWIAVPIQSSVLILVNLCLLRLWNNLVMIASMSVGMALKVESMRPALGLHLVVRAVVPIQSSVVLLLALFLLSLWKALTAVMMMTVGRVAFLGVKMVAILGVNMVTFLGVRVVICRMKLSGWSRFMAMATVKGSARKVGHRMGHRHSAKFAIDITDLVVDSTKISGSMGTGAHKKDCDECGFHQETGNHLETALELRFGAIL